MWARGGCGGNSPAPEPPRLAPAICKPHHRSSSEASVSMDQTNSDDDPVIVKLRILFINRIKLEVILVKTIKQMFFRSYNM